MECLNCHQEVEPSALFCGNCGQALRAANTSLNYALATPQRHRGETKALLAVLLGISGLVGSIFIAILGLSLGLLGLIMGTLSRTSHRRRLSTAGIALSCLAILAGLAVWTYTLSHDAKAKAAHTALASAPTSTAKSLSTPCYFVGFDNKLNISHTFGSCDMQAFNGPTGTNSSDAYKVYADKSTVTNAGTFTSLAKQAIEKDVATNLPSFNIASEQVGAFAGSPDYMVVAVDKSQNVAVAEAAVLHPVTTGYSIFILIHAISGMRSDFTSLESQWQWK